MATMAGLTAAAAFPGLARAQSTGFYEDALIIDALCFGREWGDEEYAALREAN
jgi:membrane dipeptidase